MGFHVTLMLVADADNKGLSSHVSKTFPVEFITNRREF
jgi:hypothetical protein